MTSAGGERVPPPLVFLGIAGGMLAVAVATGAASAPVPIAAAGLVLMIGGSVLHHVAARTFRSHGTTLATLAEPTELVTSGVFARTRNPMYLGGVMILIGWAALLGSPFALLGPVAWVPLAEVLFIRPEERLLERRFAEEWAGYRARARRWI